jgi:hypothetical protein
MFFALEEGESSAITMSCFSLLLGMQNEIIAINDSDSAPEDYVPIETTVLLPDDTDESTLNAFVVGQV